MKINHRLALAFGFFIASAALLSAQTPAATPPSAGKLAARPLYRDPVFDHPTDPVVVYNAESKKWFMYYTQRRGGSIAMIHGTKIGIAASEDGGATWKYIGTADITYGQDRYPTNYTYWAPEVIWVKDKYHMFLAFVPGIFNNWNHPREIAHLTSTDGIKWDNVGKVDLQSDKVIDPCVIQLPNGGWRMFYKDEASTNHHIVCYADSPDLYQWEARGNAVTDRNGEGENCIHFKGKYWLLADTDRPEGQAVWSSDDCTHWTPQDSTIYGSHGDMVVSGGRAWWFYFGGQRMDGINWAMIHGNEPTNAPDALASAPTNAPAPGFGGRGFRRGISINVVELKVIDGKLMFTDPSQPTYIDLKPVREKKDDEPPAIQALNAKTIQP
jgi:hypothetical protein